MQAHVTNSYLANSERLEWPYFCALKILNQKVWRAAITYSISNAYLDIAVLVLDPGVHGVIVAGVGGEVGVYKPGGGERWGGVRNGYFVMVGNGWYGVVKYIAQNETF